MFCTKCGNKIDDGAAFCCKCGAKLETASVENSESSNVVVKSKKDFIYERFCLYMTANPMIVGFNPTFGELENYEEGANGMVYCELVANTRNALGKTKEEHYHAQTVCTASGLCDGSGSVWLHQDSHRNHPHRH